MKFRHLILPFLLLAPVAANANLITNGTFDSDLNGWIFSGSGGGSVPTTWNANNGGEAWLGAPGTPGLSLLAQLLALPVGTVAVDVSFDYTWQVNPPTLEDLFLVEFTYVDSLSGPISTTLLSQGSNTAAFGNTVMFSGTALIGDLAAGPGNALLGFGLEEFNQTNGTRVQIDNVVVTASSAVPAPGTLALLGFAALGLAGVSGKRRRKA